MEDVEGLSDSVKLGVLIHRMGSLEGAMTDVSTKLDNMGSLYPTMMHVDLIVTPLRDAINDLKKKEEARDSERTKTTNQFKLAVTMAFFSPVASALVYLLLEGSK